MVAPRFLLILAAMLSTWKVLLVRGDEPGCQATRIAEAPPRDREDAEVLARCHFACLDVTYPQDQIEEAINASAQWPAVNLDTLTSNCFTFRNLMECRRGCVVRMKNSTITRQMCRDDCVAECKGECDGHCTAEDFYPNVAQCRRNACSKSICGVGCIAAKEHEALLSPQGSEAISPPSPLTPPTLTRPDSLQASDHAAGIYRVSYDQSAALSTGNSAQNITAFVFKIERNETNDTYYMLELVLEGAMLNLSQFACETVSVSFAAVTINGASEFSPTTHVCVYGEWQFPSQPEILSVTPEEDWRENFTNNAMLNVMWNRPITGYSFVAHYTISLFTDSEECGHSSLHNTDASVRTFHSIGRELTMFQIGASSPDSAPLFGCMYDLTLQANPVKNEFSDFTRFEVDLTDTSTATAVTSAMHLTCYNDTDKVSGNISVEAVWSIQGTQEVIDAIGEYSIRSTLVDTATGVPTIQDIIVDSTIPANKSGEGYFIVENILPQIQQNYKIKVQVNPIRTGNSGILPPDGRECTPTSVLPRKPDPIASDNVTVHDFGFRNTNYNLSLSWVLPCATYGRVTAVHVRILRRPATAEQSVRDPDIAATADRVTSETFADINGTIHGSEDAICLYLQVSISNQFGQQSEWTDSTPLRRYPTQFPDCTNPPSPTPPSVPPSNMPLYAYIILAIGICVLITMVMLAVTWLLYKQHRKKRQMRQVFDESICIPMSGSLGGHAEVGFTMSTRTLLDSWEIPSNQVIVEEELGEGCFGEVHKGIVMGPISNSRLMNGAICVTVAIKFLKSSATGSERTDFLSEIETMKQIAKGNNPHVISLIGCVTLKEPLCLITEYVKHGDLLSYLQTIRKLVMQRNRERKLAQIAGLRQPEPYLEPVPVAPPQPKLLAALPYQPEGGATGEGGVAPGEQEHGAVKPGPKSPYASLGEVEPVNLTSFAYQIASGMEHLSSLNIVHRDLACRNILVGDNKNLKITDFGMARVVNGDDVYVKTSKGRMPWKWMAVESIVNREFTSASDVWSYGIVLWEIATLGGFPYPMIPNGELLEHLKRGFRMSAPDNCRQEIYKLMLDCWHEASEERPSFTQLRGIFDAMLAANNPYIQFDNINSHQPYYNRMSSSEDGRTTGISSNTGSELPSSTSSSSVTLNGATASGYDYLKPLVGPVVDESHGRPITNPYVDTPTTRSPYDEEEGFETDAEHIQRIEDGIDQLDTPDHTVITVL